MKKTKKAVIIITVIMGLPLIFIAIILIHDAYNILTPDYMQDRYIAKGYVFHDGRIHAGKDYDCLRYYQYSQKPNLNKDYVAVTADNIERLSRAMEAYGEFDSEENTYINNADKKVSVGDYYIVKYYKCGHEVEFEAYNCKIYFYDTQTKVLYHIYYVR